MILTMPAPKHGGHYLLRKVPGTVTVMPPPPLEGRSVQELADKMRMYQAAWKKSMNSQDDGA